MTKLRWLKFYTTPRPLAFACGFFVCLLALAGLGRVVAQRFVFDDFHRLHRYLNPESLFYPTASELLDEAHANADGGQIVVVIGGSSVMAGDGQGAAELWSDDLQHRLGSDFAVVNLAMPGGAPTEHGSVVAQALLREGYRVIYVADTRAGLLGSPDGMRFQYVFWDAYSKKLIDASPAQLQRIAEYAARVPPGVDELEWQSRLDSVLYFNDLWTSFGYNVAFLTWNQLVSPSIGPFTTPHRLIPDPDPGVLNNLPAENRIPPAQLPAEINIVRSFAPLVCVQQEGGAWQESPSAEAWPDFRTDVDVDFSQSFRSHMIVLETYYDPIVVDQLSPSEQACYVRSMHLTSEIMNAANYRTVVLGASYTADDFADRVHLTGSGGDKLATDVEPLVRQAARELGYLP